MGTFIPNKLWIALSDNSRGKEERSMDEPESIEQEDEDEEDATLTTEENRN
jgi:hypothetical protein